jgi:hypothetical protein
MEAVMEGESRRGAGVLGTYRAVALLRQVYLHHTTMQYISA